MPLEHADFDIEVIYALLEARPIGIKSAKRYKISASNLRDDNTWKSSAVLQETVDELVSVAKANLDKTISNEIREDLAIGTSSRLSDL